MLAGAFRVEDQVSGTRTWCLCEMGGGGRKAGTCETVSVVLRKASKGSMRCFSKFFVLF